MYHLEEDFFLKSRSKKDFSVYFFVDIVLRQCRGYFKARLILYMEAMGPLSMKDIYKYLVVLLLSLCSFFSVYVPLGLSKFIGSTPS